MGGGLRTAVPVDSDLSDDELVEQTRAFRTAFNRYYRLRPDVWAATRYARRQIGTGGNGDSDVPCGDAA